MTTKTDQNLPSKSSLPNFNTPQQKRRTSIHKLLINTMQGRKNHKHKETEDSIPIQEKQSNKKLKDNKWTKPKIHLPKKVGSILHNVFGHKKSKGISSSSFNGRERPIYRSGPLKEIIEIEEEKEENKDEFDNRKRLRGKSSKLSLSFSGFLSKSVGLKFRKCKNNNRSNSDQIGSQFFMGNQEHERNFDSGYRKIRKGRSILRKKVSKQSEEREDEQVRGDIELWKKRILKGAKCRPVQLSGDLHCDRNGALLKVIP